jgi:hypothetical protein
MFKHFFKRRNTMPVLIKRLLLLSFITVILIVPDVLIHSLAVIAHYLYECSSFLLEEILRHHFGFEKFYAQLVVFYFSILFGVCAFFWFWKRLIKSLVYFKEFIICQCYLLKLKAIFTWHSLCLLQKIKFIFFNSAIMTITMMLLLA